MYTYNLCIYVFTLYILHGFLISSISSIAPYGHSLTINAWAGRIPVDNINIDTTPIDRRLT